VSDPVEIIIKGKDQVSGVLGDIRKGLGGLGGGIPDIKGMGAALAGPLTAGAGVAVAGVTAIGVAAFDVAQDFDQATRQIQSQLGLTAEEAEAFKPAIEQLFTSALVGSAAEGADAIAQARQQLRSLADEDLANAATKALQLSNVYGEDYAKVLNSVNTLQEQFGLSADEAFNFIAGGFQRGLNASGDFLDSIGEYSTQFANGGADASQFFSVLESGLQGGMLGTDKAADLFKEFRLRIQDGSAATQEGLAQLGLSWEEINEGLSNGSLTVADAFTLVQQALADTEDPTVRMQAGAALMGSQFEDLGDAAVAGISLAQTSMEDLAGATDELGASAGSLGTDFEQMKRELLVALLPVGEEILAVAKEYMPELKEGARVLAEWLGEHLPAAIDGLMQWWTDLNEGIWVVQQALQGVRDAVKPVRDAFWELMDQIGDLWDALPDWLTPGSPTPLEIGLIGVDRALEQLNHTLPAFEAGLMLDEPALPGLGFGGAPAPPSVGAVTVVLNIAGTVTAERDLIETVRIGLEDWFRTNT
jgi:hypothetical protein